MDPLAADIGGCGGSIVAEMNAHSRARVRVDSG